tara:strand:+ start:290 stop:565 length:276 start_codon:yes stop_codon:yes gene_type:complete
MEFKIKKIKDLKDGDIFYYNFETIEEFDLNKHNFGDDYLITGFDQIFIFDDVEHEKTKNGYRCIFVNSGHVFMFWRNKKVKVLGHYSKLID